MKAPTYLPPIYSLPILLRSHTLSSLSRLFSKGGGGGTPSVGCSYLWWVAPAPSVGCSCHNISEMKLKWEKGPPYGQLGWWSSFIYPFAIRYLSFSIPSFIYPFSVFSSADQQIRVKLAPIFPFLGSFICTFGSGISICQRRRRTQPFLRLIQHIHEMSIELASWRPIVRVLCSPVLR